MGERVSFQNEISRFQPHQGLCLLCSFEPLQYACPERQQREAVSCAGPRPAEPAPPRFPPPGTAGTHEHALLGGLQDEALQEKARCCSKSIHPPLPLEEDFCKVFCRFNTLSNFRLDHHRTPRISVCSYPLHAWPVTGLYLVNF